MKDYFRTIKMAVGYNGKPLMEQIEIGLSKGEILTLIGPNGSGKSTILKSIAGQLALLGGTIMLGSSHLEEMSLSRRAQTMAVLLTERLRTEMMTCEDVVATGRYPYTGRFGILSEKDREAVAEAMKYKLEFLSVLQEMKRKKKLTVIMSLHEIELAEIISDQILCIREHRVDRMGTPAEVLDKGYIAKLFDITEGSYEETTGNVELPAPRGEPEVFVMAGGGSGRSVYRKLQREGTPFATGILFRNDLDYPTARALAGKVIVTEAFEPVPRETLQEAKNILSNCKKLICCRKSFGSFEKENEELLNWAQEKEIEIEFQNAGEV